MTNRERWIVYPLLFFALSLGFKANYRTEASYSNLDVERLDVRRINGRPATATVGGSAFDLNAIRETIRATLDSMPQETPESGDEASTVDAENDDSGSGSDSGDGESDNEDAAPVEADSEPDPDATQQPGEDVNSAASEDQSAD